MKVDRATWTAKTQDSAVFLYERDPQPPHRDRAVRRRGNVRGRRDSRPAFRPQLRVPGHAPDRRAPIRCAPGFRNASRASSRSASSRPPPPRAIRATATRLASRRARFSEAVSPRVCRQAHGSGRRCGRHCPPTTCAARRPAPGDRGRCPAWAAARAATASAEPPAPPRRTNVERHRDLAAPRSRRATRLLSARFERLFRRGGTGPPDQALQRLRCWRRFRFHRRAVRRLVN